MSERMSETPRKSESQASLSLLSWNLGHSPPPDLERLGRTIKTVTVFQTVGRRGGYRHERQDGLKTKVADWQGKAICWAAEGGSERKAVE
jgi:hypothetical protein